MLYLERDTAGECDLGPEPVVSWRASFAEHHDLTAAVAGTRIDVKGSDVRAKHVIKEPQPACCISIGQSHEEATRKACLVALSPRPWRFCVKVVTCWRIREEEEEEAKFNIIQYLKYNLFPYSLRVEIYNPGTIQ